MKPTWSQMEALEPAECLHLLSSARFGHLGTCAGERPQVLPVNYAVLDGDVTFRTGVNTALAAGTDDRTVAFEADEIDDLMDSGWSVQVVGRARHVYDQAEVSDVFKRLSDPWAPGTRPLVVRITPEEITGRRFTKH